MTSTQNTKESDHFLILHQLMITDDRAGPDKFRQALDHMGVKNIIEQRAKPPNRMESPEAGVMVHQLDDETSFHAYAYLSPIGYLQIWMEAINHQPEPNILATARFSWKHDHDHSTETQVVHGRHAQRMYELLHAM